MMRTCVGASQQLQLGVFLSFSDRAQVSGARAVDMLAQGFEPSRRVQPWALSPFTKILPDSL